MKNTLCTLTGILGSIITTLFGGWDTGIATLILFMAIDFISGISVAAIFHNSKKTETGTLRIKSGLERSVQKIHDSTFCFNCSSS